MTNRKIFLVGSPDHLKNVPFGDRAWLEGLGLEVVQDLARADIVAARSLKREIKEEHVAPGRLVVTWTHEPKWDPTPCSLVRNHLGGGDAYVFNVYNWNIYTDNFFYAPVRGRLPELTRATIDAKQLEQAKIATFATFRRFPMMVRGRDVGIDAFRGQLAIDLAERGRNVVHGRGWPEGIAVGESRGGDWGRVKIDALNGFPFALCCENTDFDYYVTEKPWQAIQGGALPLYWPNRSFSTAFPDDSFIDLRKTPTADEVLALIDRLTVDDYIARMNACIGVYNWASEGQFRRIARERSRDLLAAVLTHG